MNLYNNGFSGGLIAIVLYPTITAIWKRRRPVLRDEDYYDLFEENIPSISPPGGLTGRKAPAVPLMKCTRVYSGDAGMPPDEPEESEQT